MQAAFIVDYQHYARIYFFFSLYSKLRTDSMALQSAYTMSRKQ